MNVLGGARPPNLPKFRMDPKGASGGKAGKLQARIASQAASKQKKTEEQAPRETSAETTQVPEEDGFTADPDALASIINATGMSNFASSLSFLSFSIIFA